MKTVVRLFMLLVLIAVITQCTGRGKTGQATENDTISVPDTGFTGIKKGMSGNYAVNEITYKNGVREGLAKTFYASGRVRTTQWYVNGKLQDSICWFYEEGQLFRTTPYKNDTIDGIQKQFYRTGQIKAKIGFTGGLRNQLFEEFTKEGKLVTDYPRIDIKTQDKYKSAGSYQIMLSRADKSDKVKFFRGEFTNGVFDTTKVEHIRMKDGTGYLELIKGKKTNPGYVGVISQVQTIFGNKRLEYIKIDVPYSDLY